MNAPGLYLHLPFCSAICPYCDFAVLKGGASRKRRFVDSLIQEMELWAGGTAPFAGIDTVYFGGGTPSAHPPEEIALLLDAARRLLPLVDRPRVCFEANPEDVTPESVRAWRQLGIDFLSLGVQAFDDPSLRFLGRRHREEDARGSVETALAAGFATVSLDLIYGLLGGTPEGWEETLETAISLQPQHLSCYQLTFHEGTPFGRALAQGKLFELPEDDQGDLFEITHSTLAAAGLPGYEVSSFAASPAHRSPHNPKYWDHTAYLGLGPSAHSFDGRRRWWNERSLAAWEGKLALRLRPIEGSEELTAADLALETLLLGLRTVEGVDLERFRSRFGYDLLERNEPLVERLAEGGLLSMSRTALVPTLAGWGVADALARSFELRSAGSAARG